MADLDGNAIFSFHTAGDSGDYQAVGRLCVQTGNKRINNLIAATAQCHNLMVVTRNVMDFEPSGVRVFDPFNLPEASGTAG